MGWGSKSTTKGGGGMGKGKVTRGGGDGDGDGRHRSGLGGLGDLARQCRGWYLWTEQTLVAFEKPNSKYIQI